MKASVVAPERLSAESPWPGLRPFSESDRDFFFGRDREIGELRALIVRAAVVVLYGQSGLGKTSILQAGLFHDLKGLNLLPFRLRLDHSEQAPPLAEQLKTALAAQLDAAGVDAPRATADESLWEYFHRRDVDFWGPRNRLLTPVIVLDQFEEIFTLGQRSEPTMARVARFVDELEALLEHRPPEEVRASLERAPDDGLKYDFRRQSVKLVITLREDFLAHLDTWRTRMPSLLPHRFRLERMTGAQALEVVERGGRHLVEPAVARDIVDFVSGSQRKRQSSDLASRKVEPALLSVVCDELNRRRIERRQATVTADLLSGERAGIIQAFYERAFEGINPATREWIEDDLLTASGYRDRGALEDALKLGLKEADFDRLVDRRVLHREERDGVVWLELTHDLLSDPAVQSRGQRDSRRQAEEAARREAESAQRLRRATRLTAVFGMLLVVMFVALALAFTKWREAAQARIRADAASEAARTAASQASASAVEATRSAVRAEAEADRATASFDTALDTADRLGSRLMDYVRRDMRVPTATVLEVIRGAEDTYAGLAAQAPSSEDVRQLHARFLTTAAQAQYQVGHIANGLADARHALSLFAELPAATEPSERMARAEALYARGYGLMTTGDLDGAQRDFNEAIGLVGGASSARGTPASARIFCLAHLGLGEIQLSRLTLPAARLHFSRVVDFLGNRPASGVLQDSGPWRVDALRGMAQGHYRSADIQHWLTRADEALRSVVASDSDNPRWLRLDAEIAYRRGRNAIDLLQPPEAVRFFERATRATAELARHDPDNLEWRFNGIRSARGIASGQISRSQLQQARAALQSAQQEAAALLAAEPAWTAVQYLNGALLYELGDLDRYGATPNLDRAAILFREAAAQFEAIRRRAPRYREAMRGAAISVSSQGLVFAARQKHDAAIQAFQQTIRMLAPMMRVPGIDERVLDNHAFALRMLAVSYTALQKHDDAQSVLRQAVGTLSGLAGRSPQASTYLTLSQTLVSLGDTFTSRGDALQAAIEYQRAAAAAEQARLLQPHSIAVLSGVAQIHLARAGLSLRRRELAAASEQVRHGMVVIWDGLKREPWNSTLQNDLDALRKLATTIVTTATSSPEGSGSAKGVIATANQLLASHALPLLVDWIAPTQMSGAWRNLVGGQLAAARQTLLDADRRFTAEQILAVRRMPLEFYKGGELHEAAVLTSDGIHGIVPFVTRPGRKTVVLAGTSPPIHEMNAETPPLLGTAEQASQYLRFFDSSVYGDEGPFAVIEEAVRIQWEPEADQAVVDRTVAAIRPVRMSARPEGGWQSDATILYANALFYVTQVVQASGMVEMLDDEPVAVDLPITINYFANGVRLARSIDAPKARLARLVEKVRANPRDVQALNDLAREQSSQKAWTDAVSTQQRLIEARLAAKQAPATLAGAYLSLSWYQLFARDFAGALASTDAGRAHDPSSLPLDTNRAHALLFLGRISEAEQLYRSHIGKTMGPQSKDLWQDVILADFDQLMREKITHPEMARIRKMLTTAARK